MSLSSDTGGDVVARTKMPRAALSTTHDTAKKPVGSKDTRASRDFPRRDLRHYYLVGNYPPLLSMRNVEADAEQLAREYEVSIAAQPVDVYLHFPFCKTAGKRECTFCHFYKERYDPKLEESYVRHMIRELEGYTKDSKRLTVASLYFGGGTFSLVSPRNLRVLVSALQRLLAFAGNVEIKFEVHADAAKDTKHLREILSILKDLGTTHIVVDIQTLHQQSLDSITHSRLQVSDYFKTLDMCLRAGFKRFVTGLIVGLPYETTESFHRGLERLRRIEEIATINAFPLMFRPGDLVCEQLASQLEIFPSVSQRDLMSLDARACLSNGSEFLEGPIYFHNRKGTSPRQQTDKFEGKTLIGVGPSAFGFFNQGTHALQYFNVPDIYSYMQRVGNGERPLWYAGRLDRDELARRQVIFGLNLIRPVDFQSIDKAFGTSLSSEYNTVVLQLTNSGLLERTPKGFQLTDRGLLRAEEISLLFCSADVISGLVRNADSPELLRYNYFPRPAEASPDLRFDGNGVVGDPR